MVDYDPQVSVQFHRTAAERAALTPEGPEDPFVVYLSDPNQILNADVQRRAFGVARNAAAEQRQVAVVIERAAVLPRETLDVVRALGQESGADEIAVYVERLK